MLDKARSFINSNIYTVLSVLILFVLFILFMFFKIELGMNPNKKIAVVGSGLAGLTAAYELQEARGDVHVYEARNRVGGRVFSAYLEHLDGTKSVINLGAQNLADGGSDSNVIKLSQDLGLSISTISKKIDFKIISEDKCYNFNELVAEYLGEVDDVSSFIAGAVRVAKPKNMQELLDNLFVENDILKSSIATLMHAYEGASLEKQSVYPNIETLEAMLSGGISKANNETEHADEHVTLMFIEGGNAKLPLELASRLENKVNFGYELVTIERLPANNSEGNFRLIFNNGEKVVVDRVVLAVPASVYQDITFKGFDYDKDAPASLVYGDNYKVYYPFVNEDPLEGSVYISNGAISLVSNDTLSSMLYVNGIDVDYFNSSKNVENAFNMTSLPLEDITVNKAEDDRQYMTYKGKIITHNWNEDKYTKGSYSLFSGQDRQTITHNGVEFLKMFAPIDNKLYFAGEHTTITDYIGTMEAAVESGKRVADAIIKGDSKAGGDKDYRFIEVDLD